jgi:anti-sigma factor RsiW
MNVHPTDSIPAFVLGALDPEEALQVGEHLATCPTCRAEADAFRATLDVLPYAVPLLDPPSHVKQQILARIAASHSQPWPSAAMKARSRWLVGLLAGSLLLALAFGYMMADARSRLDLMTSQFLQSQQQLDALRRQAAEDQMASFIMAPQTVARQLASVDRNASAMIYMQPDLTRAVLVIHGMPKLAPGKIYQFWLTKPGAQVPATTFDVDEHGMATLMIEAPAPVDQYAQVMVTVEHSGGSTQPSDQIVLSGSLASVPHALGTCESNTILQRG